MKTMDMRQWKVLFLQAVIVKLDAERDVFDRCNACRLDIGIFPWHGFIELSIQSVGESALTDRVADWSLYNFSEMQEGKWPEAEALGNEMMAHWTTDPSRAEKFLEAAGEVAKSSELRSRLLKFCPAHSVEVTVLNPDKWASLNYAA